MRKKGYSLVEMLVVIAIVALMTAIVVPQIAFQQKGAGLKGAATEMVSALRAVRRLAIAEREYRVLAINLYPIPGEFVMMRPRGSGDPATPIWIQVGEARQLPNNIAIVAAVAANDSNWTNLDILDITRTDDANPINGVEDLTISDTMFNPANGDGLVNDIYRLIRFYPTGTADSALIYLWNVTEGRREIPNPSVNLSLSNISALGVPPGLNINAIGDQTQFFNVPTGGDDSPDDAYYYTLEVSPITGSVIVYDYAWGGGWDRKKDGE